MRAPFFIVNRHNHVVIRAELDEIDDSAWNVIASTGFFPHATIVENKNIHVKRHYKQYLHFIGMAIRYNLKQNNILLQV